MENYWTWKCSRRIFLCEHKRRLETDSRNRCGSQLQSNQTIKIRHQIKSWSWGCRRFGCEARSESFANRSRGVWYNNRLKVPWEQWWQHARLWSSACGRLQGPDLQREKRGFIQSSVLIRYEETSNQRKLQNRTIADRVGAEPRENNFSTLLQLEGNKNENSKNHYRYRDANPRRKNSRSL